jgi:uncharacterized membrane protein YcaP (DUF421 family)
MEVVPFDLKRMFLGDLPPLFLLEIAVRTAILFLYTLLMIRLIGKRGLGQLTPFELVIIISLGSAVGDPMFYPDVPLLHGMVVITTVTLLQRNLVHLVHTRERIEQFVEGQPAPMIVDGRLELESMKQERFSRDELFSTLRLERVEHLGQVKHAYLEENGQISVFLFTPRETRPGLPIVPPRELDLLETFSVGTAAPTTEIYACVTCGETIRFQKGQPLSSCSRCEGEAWAVAEKEASEDQSEEDPMRRRRPFVR